MMSLSIRSARVDDATQISELRVNSTHQKAHQKACRAGTAAYSAGCTPLQWVAPALQLLDEFRKPLIE